jgi:hypothetical protein
LNHFEKAKEYYQKTIKFYEENHFLEDIDEGVLLYIKNKYSLANTLLIELYDSKAYNIQEKNMDLLNVISMHEKNIYLIEKKYKTYSPEWNDIYFNTLKALSEQYMLFQRNSNKSKKYFDKAKKLIKKLYEKDENRWKSEYIRISNTNIEILVQNEKYSLALTNGLKNITLIEKYFYENISLWGSAYSISLLMSLIAAKMLNKKKIMQELIDKYNEYLTPNEKLITGRINKELKFLINQFENKPSFHHEKAVKVGRNDPCPCGSGKKYKKCCGKN